MLLLMKKRLNKKNYTLLCHVICRVMYRVVRPVICRVVRPVICRVMCYVVCVCIFKNYICFEISKICTHNGI